jgi:hypothetical protein
MPFSESDFINNETTRLYEKKDQVDHAVSSQKRLSQLNESYRKRYAKYIEVFIVLIFSFVAYLGINILQEKFPQIPNVAFDAAVLIILVLVAYYLFYAVIELWTRSELNYDELDLPPISDPSGVDVSTLNHLKNAGALSQTTTATTSCVGAGCCNPTGIATTNATIGNNTATRTIWDPDTGKCKAAFTTLEQAFQGTTMTLPTRSAGSTEIANDDPTTLSFGRA